MLHIKVKYTVAQIACVESETLTAILCHNICWSISKTGIVDARNYIVVETMHPEQNNQHQLIDFTKIDKK